jgi:hypothetical protein
MATKPATKASAPAPAPKAVAKKVETITLRNVSEKLAEDNALSKKHVQDLLDGLVGQMANHLKSG